MEMEKHRQAIPFLLLTFPSQTQGGRKKKESRETKRKIPNP
jgi:hypothetical protein